MTMCVSAAILILLALCLHSELTEATPALQLPKAQKKCDYTIDAFFLQDISASYKDDLPHLRKFLPEFMEDLIDDFPYSRVAFSTFTDYPFPDVGFRSYLPHDYCFKLDMKFTSDMSKLQKELDDLQPISGRDIPEAQLVALHHVAVAGYFPKEDKRGGKPILKFIVLSTDAPFHEAGDLEKERARHQKYWDRPDDRLLFGDVTSLPTFTVKPNDGDEVIECGQYGSLDFEDYPSRHQVGNALAELGAGVLFLVTKDRLPFYNEFSRQLRDDFGVVSVVSALRSDSADIWDVLQEGFDDVAVDLCETTTSTKPPTCEMAVDFHLVQDMTHSYSNDLPNLKALLPDVVTYLRSKFVLPRFGLSSFGDKPIGSFGSAVSGDYCYRLHTPLTFSDDAVEDALNQLKIVSGVDWRESQLDGMLASTTSNVGWRVEDKVLDIYPLVRIVALATDTGWHKAGDGAKHGITTPNSGTGNLQCLTEDYPSVMQVVQRFKALKISPLFIVTGDMQRLYQKLADTFTRNGVAAFVSLISDNSQDIVTSVRNGMQNLCNK